MAVGEGRTETTVYFCIRFFETGNILFGDTWLKFDNCRHVRRIRTEGRGMRLVRTCANSGRIGRLSFYDSFVVYWYSSQGRGNTRQWVLWRRHKEPPNVFILHATLGMGSNRISTAFVALGGDAHFS